MRHSLKPAFSKSNFTASAFPSVLQFFAYVEYADYGNYVFVDKINLEI